MPRLPALTGLRGLVALLVVVYHVVYVTAPGLADATHPEPVRYLAAHLGSSAVAIFFVLSGFLLARPWLAHLADAGPPVAIARYARARFWRVFPAWWLALLVLVPLAAPQVLGRPLDLVLLATLQQNYADATLLRVITPGWTLAVEVAFYAVLGVAIWAATPRLLRLDRTRRLQVVAAALLGVVVASAALGWWWFAPGGGQGGPDRRVLSYTLPLHADHFAWGMLAALAAVRRGTSARGGRTAWPFVGAALVAVDAYLFWNAGHGEVSRSLVAVAGALLVYGLHRPGTLAARALAVRPLLELGRLSYALYLWHLPLLYLAVERGLVTPDRPAQTPLVLAGLLAVSLAAAEVSHRLVERPALRRATAEQRTTSPRTSPRRDASRSA